MTETQQLEEETDYEQLAEEYQELADALDEIEDRLDFIANHKQVSDDESVRARYAKEILTKIHRGFSWHQSAYQCRQAAEYASDDD